MKQSLGHWNYEGNSVNLSEYFGFIYRITNKVKGLSYIGKKQLEFKTCKKPLKGNTNRRRGTKPSDWESYTGSCKRLNEDIIKLGKDNFQFDILQFCHSKMELSYFEVWWIFHYNALFSDMYYNEYVGCRMRNKKKEQI